MHSKTHAPLLDHGLDACSGGGLIIGEANVLLGTRTLDELGKREHTDKQHCSAGSHNGGSCTVLGADVEVVVLQAILASCSPLLVGADGVVLGAVEELREGDISLVSENVVGLEVVAGAILELDPQEVPVLGCRSTTELKSEGGSEVGEASEFGVVLGYLEHVEERNERVVAGLNEEELEGVTVECDALERVEDEVQNSTTRQVTDTANILASEECVLVEVSKTTSLLNQGRREPVRKSLVMDELRVHVVVDVPRILQCGGATKDVVPDGTKEWLRGLSLLLELRRSVDPGDVILEGGAVRPGFEGAVIAWLDGLDRNVLVSTEGCDNGGLVCEGDFVFGRRRE